jgi:hypothetical protein
MLPNMWMVELIEREPGQHADSHEPAPSGYAHRRGRAAQRA